MHAQPIVSIPDPVDYKAPKKYVLVLSCMDARLLDDLVRFLEHDNLTNRYYHLTLAGTSLGLTDRWQRDVSEQPANFDSWRQSFIDHVQAAVLLTQGKISDIYIVQHEDCGAFRAYLNKDATDMSPEEEVQLHREYAESLMDDLVQNFCSTYNPKHPGTEVRVQEIRPSVHIFYQDLRGGVRHLESRVPPAGPEGKCKDYACYCSGQALVKPPRKGKSKS